MKQSVREFAIGVIAAILSASGLADDSNAPANLPTVGAESGIKFRLFDYGNSINSSIPGGGRWVSCRNNADDLPDNTNEDVDADGFVPNHATVKPLLENGYPVFLGTRGGVKYCDDFSLGFLFGAGGQDVVEKPATNTLLRIVGDHYAYNSKDNAADYDEQLQCFFVRPYTERTSATADFAKDGDVHNDFLPFNHWDGATIYRTEGGVEYNFDSSNVNYWFGYSLEYAFLMPPGGKMKGMDMVFSFSGDDDVWVFIDDVLVLDLGGTHGMCTGTINFKTGDVTAHIDWLGDQSTYSYPTTIKAQFDKAGRGSPLVTRWGPTGVTFADGTIHTLKMFYLERGGSVANCNLDFNMSTLPDVFTMPVKLWITDHADAGPDKVHLAFEPVFETKMSTSELKAWIAKASSEKRIRIAAADSKEGLQTAEMELVPLRDGHGEHDIDKGWVWVTVPSSAVGGEPGAGRRYVKVLITEGGYEDENIVINGMPADFAPLSKVDGVTTFAFAEANTNISLKLKTPMRLEEALVVGGGGGGHTLGGGGGGGGVKTLSNAPVDFAAGTVGVIWVGAGGAATPAGNRDVPSQNGGDSRLHLGNYLLSALGGGGGGTHKDDDTAETSPIHGHSGGNGGGGANGGRGGTGLEGGFDGAGTPADVQLWRFGGGGGGAGGAASGINAGRGIVKGITGVDVMYGSGGAGCLLNDDNATVATGTAYPNGGQATSTFGGAGRNGTGGGGAGGGIDFGRGVEYPGGAGGCGIVVIRLRAL